MNRYGIILVIVVAILIVAYGLIESGLYLRLVGDHYGRAYNSERLKGGQPIIEDYFSKKPQRKNRQLQVWSDSTGVHVHTDKSYYLTEFGNLAYETDSYRPPVDSTWLKQRLEITDFRKLDFWEFNRLHYFGQGTESYDILYRLKDEPYRTATLDLYVGDSLYRTIIGAAIQKRVAPSGPPF